METINFTSKKIRKTTLFIFLTLGVAFCIMCLYRKIAKSRPTAKEHVAICKYMGTEYEKTNNFAPDFGYIPFLSNVKSPLVETSDVAAKVGITILNFFYGKKMTEIQKPYSVYLINDEVWEVRGCIPYQNFYIQIQRSDCRILSICGYSYEDYITGEGIYSKRKIKLTDYISNYTSIRHSSLPYEYQGERHVENLPFVRLPLRENDKNKRLPKWMPDNGYTPDASVCALPHGVLEDYKTAAKVGIIILSSIYGDKHIQEQFPFEVYLRGTDYWAIIGSLHPEGAFGGTAHINLQKSDCRILSFYHEK